MKLALALLLSMTVACGGKSQPAAPAAGSAPAADDGPGITGESAAAQAAFEDRHEAAHGSGSGSGAGSAASPTPATK